MNSKIAVEGMEFYSYHGFYKEEQKIGGKYIVDAYLQFQSDEKWLLDELSKTINYEKVYGIVTTEMAIPSKLIETVCKRIFDKVKQFAESDVKDTVQVRIKVTKCSPPINGLIGQVYVELEG
jgi:7,8-dihydroneopterin aldolase/epimerase/oxygenase